MSGDGFDDLGFSPIDDDLARDLRARGSDASNVLDGLRPRLARARRRHRAVVGTLSTLGAAAVIAAVLVVVQPGPGSVRTPPANQPNVTSTTTTAPSVTPDTGVPGTGGTTPSTFDDNGGNRGPGDSDDSSGPGSGDDSDDD